MEYHQDRFDDYSLMIFKEEQLLAVFPANISEAIVFSHQGLTYGGLVFKNELNTKILVEVYETLVAFLKAENIKSIVVKPLLDFYNFQRTKSVGFWQTQDNSAVIKRNIVLAIDFNSEYKIHKTKLKRYKKLEKNGFTIKEGKLEFEKFWNTILVKRLKEKHNSKPIHDLSEIQYLHDRFESEICQYNIYNDENLLAGITIFKKGLVVKSQYGMASVEGEQSNALDMLFVYLIHKFRDEGMHYFSMGTVNDDSKLGFSKGMLKQKQELGCSTYFQDIIKVELND
ncbi:FemAB family protein [Psychroserpens sp. AS72]|uniref:FemAB family protein n=1 Tax=Psychroserpens sp. AS72 TaxID=3135775 RepID=UPI00316CBBB3